MRQVFSVNGKNVELVLSPEDTLLGVLRSNGYTEVKNGCEEGECGACMVLMDGKPVPSCQVLAMSAAGSKITTVKGLGTIHEASVIQSAFVDEGAVQCGFCASGMILSTWALLAANPDPTDEEIRSALDGNLCRCTGYAKIVNAVKSAAETMRTRKKNTSENRHV